jgi:hypothetical protein
MTFALRSYPPDMGDPDEDDDFEEDDEDEGDDDEDEDEDEEEGWRVSRQFTRQYVVSGKSAPALDFSGSSA